MKPPKYTVHAGILAHPDMSPLLVTREEAKLVEFIRYDDPHNPGPKTITGRGKF